jgi:hypothetical protein
MARSEQRFRLSQRFTFIDLATIDHGHVNATAKKQTAATKNDQRRYYYHHEHGHNINITMMQSS